MFLEVDRLACNLILCRSLSRNHTPSHARLQTGRHTPSLPFSALFPGPQLDVVPSTVAGTGTRTRLFFFSPRAHPWSPFFSSLSLPLACSLNLLTVTQTHLYIPTHTPPLPCVGVHIRKKPGNPADAGASAPSSTSTSSGLAWDSFLRVQGGGRR